MTKTINIFEPVDINVTKGGRPSYARGSGDGLEYRRVDRCDRG